MVQYQTSIALVSCPVSVWYPVQYQTCIGPDFDWVTRSAAQINPVYIPAADKGGPRN